MRRWWRWRREVRALERELYRIRRAISVADYAYHDSAVVFRDTPGAWGDGGQIAKAQEAVTDGWAQYREVDSRLRRLRELGPVAL